MSPYQERREKATKRRFALARKKEESEMTRTQELAKRRPQDVLDEGMRGGCRAEYRTHEYTTCRDGDGGCGGGGDGSRGRQPRTASCSGRPCYVICQRFVPFHFQCPGTRNPGSARTKIQVGRLVVCLSRARSLPLPLSFFHYLVRIRSPPPARC